MFVRGKIWKSKYTLKEFPKEQEELKKNENDTLFFLTYNEEYWELWKSEVFGSLNVLGGKAWNPGYVYTLDDSIVAEINIE